MASAEDYAQWIVDNQDKQGTPEFETVAKAYTASREPSFRQKLQASAPMRVVQGMRDPIDAAAQLLPRGLEQVTSLFGMAPNKVSEFFGDQAKQVDQGISENEREYEQARQITGQQGADIARFGGNVVSPANLALASRLPAAATTVGRIGTGLVGGGVGGALQPVDTEKNPDFSTTKTGQVALGAATGAVATPLLGRVGDWVGKRLAGIKKPDAAVIQRATREMADELNLDWKNLPAREQRELQDMVTKAVRKTAGLEPAAAARVQDFKQERMPYLLGQVTRDPAQFAREKNLSQLAGTGDPIRERLSQQGAMMQNKIRALSGGASEQQSAGGAIAQALRDYDDKLAKEVSGAYKVARNATGKDVETPIQGLAQDVAEVIDNFGDKVPSGVVNNLRKYGVLEGGDMTQRKLFTVESADKLLKVINANQSNDPATNAALAALRSAVKKTVSQDVGVDDVFAEARKLAASRFSQQDALPALEAAASGRANPDAFIENFIIKKSAQTKHVKELAAVLRDKNPDAFKEARNQLGAYLQRKAFGENITGDKPFSQERFGTALRELGTDKLEAFFSAGEVAQLKRLARIGAYMESVPNASKPNTSGNWGAITSLAQKIPGIPTGLALGGALKSGIDNQLNVNASLAAKPPANLSAKEIKLMSQILAGGSFATGAASAQQLK